MYLSPDPESRHNTVLLFKTNDAHKATIYLTNKGKKNKYK